MASILKKAQKYKRISTVLYEGEAHLKDQYTPPPQILQPPTKRKEKNPDDITDFPKQKTIPLPENIGYLEGKYRPASIPLISGFYPYNIYLQQGKVYEWCSCGMTTNGTWCNQTNCNGSPTRNRPMLFTVDTSGYYKLCNCKQSSNAPFCNGTHRLLVKL